MIKRRTLRVKLVSLLTMFLMLTTMVPQQVFAATPSTPFTIAVLGTSDLHGQLMGYNYFTKAAASGMTRLAPLVAGERAKYPNNILVDAGDEIQGTPLVYNYNVNDKTWINDSTKTYPMIAAFNYLKYDALVLGNHEFNFGLGILGPVIDKASAANIPYLSANTIDTTTNQTWSKVKPYTIKTFKDPDGNDFKVGILGLTTPAIPNWESPQNYAGLKFSDIVTEGSKWVQYLKSNEKVNAIVAVIHSGEGTADPSTESTPNENEVLAFANANPDVSAIVCGHTHVVLNKQEGLNKIWTVEPKNGAANLEEVLLNFTKNANGSWVLDNNATSAASLPVTSTMPEDPNLVNLLKPYHDAALQYMNTKVGTAAGEFSAHGQTVKDTALMDLVNKVQMYYGQADLSAAAPFSPTARIPKGDVTVGDVSSVYVYENFLFTVKVTGAQLRKYMEFSVGRYYKQYQTGDVAVAKNNVPDYNLDILAGADYTVDLTKTGLFDASGAPIPNGQPRITSLKFKGSEVQDSDVFKLALNNYRVNGGGGFLAAAGIVPQASDPNAPNYITYDSQKALGDDGQVRSLMIQYFRDVAAGKVPGVTSITPSYDNNWQTVPRFYDLVEFTDTHGNIDNNPASGAVKASAALMAGAVNKERQTYGDERTLLLSGGDMMQGTPISNVLKGKPVIDVMNQMKFDAMEIGNHEFDWGLDTLDAAYQSAQFPFLVANMKLKNGNTDTSAAQFFKDTKPYTILDKDGLKVAVIGVITPDTQNIVMPSIVNNFEFEDPAQTVNNLVPVVKAQGADIVIVVSHIGDQYNSWPATGNQPASEPVSQDLASMTAKLHGVQAVFGGHSHTTNYAMVNDADGKQVPVAIGYANGKGAAVIRLALDANNNIIGANPNYLDIYNRLYASLTPDAAVQAIIDQANAQIGPVFNEVIGKAEAALSRSTATSGNMDSNLGDWAADVIRKAGNADFAFQNSGGLRIDIPQGDITVGQIWTLMPFDNEINTMQMTGLQLQTVLEYMVSGIKGIGHISGLRFAFDATKPARFTLAGDGKTVVDSGVNSRIVSMTLPDGSPIDLKKTYLVAAPDFIATGGDQYPFPANSSSLTDIHILVRDALINAVKTQKTLNYQPDGRIASGTSQPVITPTPVPEPKVLKVTASALRLRVGPGLNYRIAGSLARGTQVQFLESANDWTKVLYNGKTYYMYSQYLQPANSTPAATAMLKVTASALRLRVGPGLNYRIAGYLARGTRVQFLASAMDWTKVLYNGESYYMYARYLAASY